MINSKIISSIELLKISKPRVQLIQKELITNLIQLTNTEDPENLKEFKSLCLSLKNKGITNISQFISENIIDYKINMNSHSSISFINLELIFKNNFPINYLNIKNLTL